MLPGSLDTLKLVDLPPHGTFPSIHAGAVITPCAACAGCPQIAEATHATMQSWQFATEPPDAPTDKNKLHLKTFRAMQWLIWKLWVSHGLLGRGSDIQADVSTFFCDANYWVIYEASGNELLLRLVDKDANPRRLTLWTGKSVEPELGEGFVIDKRGMGQIQAGDIVEFDYPSVLQLKSKPMVVRVLGESISGTDHLLRIEVDRDVSNAKTNIGGGTADVVCGTWREAGDPCKWNEAPHVEPDDTGLRCKWARRDYNASVGNYSATPGVVINEDGEHWYCAMRGNEIAEMVDTDDDGFVDKWQYTPSPPSMLTTFPADGHCSQSGCSLYEAVGTAAWRTRDDAGQVLQQLWASWPTKMKAVYPPILTPASANYTFSRIETPSLYQLCGGVPVETPAGAHEQVWIFQGGHGQRMEYDTDEGKKVRVKIGHAWNVETPWAWDGTMAHPPSGGSLATGVTDYMQHHDPLSYGESVTTPADYIQHGERMGLRWMRDTGQRTGRGFARWGHLESIERPVIIPRIKTAAIDGIAIFTGSDGCAFIRLGIPIGDYGGYIQLVPIRQPDKPPRSIASRVIHSATRTGDVVRLQLENVTHYASTVIDLEDVPYHWEAGGGPLCRAPDWAAVHYWDEAGAMGDPAGELARGDTVELGLEGDFFGVPYSERRFAVLSVTPHGGDEAVDWGGTEPSGAVCKASDYITYARKRDVIEIRDADGALPDVGDLAGITVTGWWSDGWGVAHDPDWVEYQSLAWAAIGAGDFAHDASRGRTWIKQAWLLAGPAQICLKV